jgi:hypothetical protein
MAWYLVKNSENFTFAFTFKTASYFLLPVDAPDIFQPSVYIDRVTSTLSLKAFFLYILVSSFRSSFLYCTDVSYSQFFSDIFIMLVMKDHEVISKIGSI